MCKVSYSFLIFQESIPPSSDIDTIKNLFKQFGTVAYVSLPKYRRSGKIKEFAFVEFEDVSSVDRCLTAFKDFDGIIDGNNSQPEQLLSVKAYVKEQEEIEKEDEKEPKNEENSGTTMEIENEKAENAPNTDSAVDKKRKLEDGVEGNSTNSGRNKENVVINEGNDQSTDFSDVDSLYSNASLAKRRRFTEGSIPEASKTEVALHGSGDNNETSDRDGGEDVEDAEDENNAGNDDEMDESGGHRKNRRKRRRRKEHHCPPMPMLHGHLPIFEEKYSIDKPQTINDLRITTKGEWKRLRNKYLMFQRQQYSQVKREMYKKQSKQGPKVLPRPVVFKNKQPFQTQTNQVTSAKAIRSNARNMNFYGANKDAASNGGLDENSVTLADGSASGGQEHNDDSDPIVDSTNAAGAAKAAQLAKKPLFEYEPGVIVKVNFDGPCVDVVDFKSEMKQYSCVRYVDLREGQTAAYVRVDNSRSAPTIIKQCAPNRCQILTGEPEKAYWNKINIDREQKLTKVVRVRGEKKRGRNKIIAASNASIATGIKVGGNSHIRFDE